MIKTTLYNMIESNSKSYTMFKPNKINNSKYEIIYSSDISVFLQFVLYVKFVNSIEISQPDNKTQSIELTNFPYNGMLYSCEITPHNPLIIKINPMDLCSKIIIKNKLETPLNTIQTQLRPIEWNKIFVINLKRRTDRKKQMEEFFSKANIPETKYEFIEAYDGTEPTIIAQYQEIKKSNPSNPIITAGHFACLLSHLKVIQIAKSREYNSIMVLEDDVNTGEPDFVKKLHSIKIPEYDMLYLGGIMSKKKHFVSNWAYSNGTNIIGAYGYMLSHTIFDTILSELKDLNEYIDFFYLNHIQQKYKTICLEDIIKTDLTSSDTSNKSRIMKKRLNYINNL
jgi:GR25 family glycosyltransferase involved in LPS biosynthesis